MHPTTHKVNTKFLKLLEVVEVEKKKVEKTSVDSQSAQFRP